MEIYNCKVLVGGSRMNEVRKESIPAAEIFMLRHLHGDESVLDIKHVGTSNLSDKEVRELLALSYGPGDVDTTRAGPAILREVFGPPGVALVKEIEGVEKREKPKSIPSAHIKRLRDIKPEDDVRPAEPAKVLADAFTD